MTARKSESPDAPAAEEPASGAPLVGLDSAVFSGVTVKLDAQLGSVTLSVRELLTLKAGEIVTLETGLGELVELQINGKPVGRGEIVAVNDAFGVRIVEIATAK
jgi:flagellar motor switch protein FliN